jgi:16S rRNA (uracil1498-N3)-methyltransferase
MHRFYSSELSENQTEIHLGEEESQHACKVLRLKKGTQVEIFNGVGSFVRAEIIEAHHKKCLCKVIEKQIFPSDDKYIHLAFCPTKTGDRFEWMVEKAVEIGVSELTPLIGDNSERQKVNLERLHKIILSATKQSQRMFLPKLNPISSVSDFIIRHPQALMAHCAESVDKTTLTNFAYATKNTIMIGPEGDFSRREIILAEEQGLRFVSLGNNRLRTETAGVVAVTLLIQ